METHSRDAHPVFDSLDIDLVVKVLERTVFSPFFVLLVVLFYVFHGARYTDPQVRIPSICFVILSLFWITKWCSKLWRNQLSPLYRSSRLDWGEQIVLVTGGSSGMGELLANTLAVRHVTVVVLDVNPIRTENPNIVYYKCDVSKWEEVHAISKKIAKEVGDPTIIINNAGVVQGKLLLDLKPDDVQQTFGVNTLSHFWVLKAFLPAMIRAKTGHIVTMSSVMGLVGSAQMTDYNASKAATISLHESLRYELDKRYRMPNIRTTLVLPGHVFTPMFSIMSLPSSWLYKFLAPSLPPVTVVKAIITALDEQHSQTIFLPFYTYFTSCLKALPSFLRDILQWMSGADYAMNGFVKVSGLRVDEMPQADSDVRKGST